MQETTITPTDKFIKKNLILILFKINLPKFSVPAIKSRPRQIPIIGWIKPLNIMLTIFIFSSKY